jgi:malate/lactate dehydrogenase
LFLWYLGIYLISADKQFNIGIIGPGDLGRQSAVSLIENEKELLPYKLGTLYMAGKNIQETDLAIRQVNQRIRKKVRDIVAWGSSDLEELLDKVDIFLITADANRGLLEKVNAENQRYREVCYRKGAAVDKSKLKVPDRKELTKNNIEMIKGLAGQFKPGYKGTVIIASNLTDVLAYTFASYSGVNPYRVVGLNHLDTIRLHEAIKGYFKSDNKLLKDVGEVHLRSFAIGPHDNPYCVFNMTSYSGLDITFPHFLDNQGKRTSLASSIDEDVRLDGRLQMSALRSTNLSTAGAVFETIKACLDGKTEVTASTYFKKHNVFVGLPVIFRNRAAKINMEWYGKALKDYDKDEIVKRIQRLQGDIKDIGIKPISEAIRPRPKKSNTFIYAATEQQHEILRWPAGNYSRPTRYLCQINGEERSVYGVKIGTFDGRNYVLGSTFNGVFAKSIDNPADIRQFLIKKPDRSKGIIRSIETLGDSIYGAHSISNEGFGLVRWSFNSTKTGEYLFDGPVRKVQTNQEMLYFSSGNMLYTFTGRGRKAIKYSNEHPITFFSVDDHIFLGDSNGDLKILEKSGRVKAKSGFKNSNMYPISSGGIWKIDGNEYIIAGDEQGFVSGYDPNFKKKFSHWLGKNEITGRGAIQDIKPVLGQVQSKLLVAVSDRLQEHLFRDLLRLKDLTRLFERMNTYGGSNHMIYSICVN